MKVLLYTSTSLFFLTNVSFAQDTSNLTKSPLQKALYDSLTNVLLQVDYDDQKYRNQLDYTEEKYGGKSPQMKSLYHDMGIADSLNLLIVQSIISKYGWLGADDIGSQSNKALFMVIQHSSLPVQQTYLPLMREAVKIGNAYRYELAMLEDRVALREGRSQLYGSQVAWNYQNNTFRLFPITDPDNLDKRRASVGLPPYTDYLAEIGLVWNLAQYKKDLSEIKKQCKAKALL